MKRLAITLADIAERGNLVRAAWKAARGKRQRPPVAAYLSNLDERTATLSKRILEGRAPLGESHSFVIRDPKRREISAACFEDRVLHHAILALAEPRFEQALVPWAYACRPGCGVHAAALAVQRGLRHHPWVVQVDVAGYFNHIDHEVLLTQLERRFKGQGFLELLARIVALGSVAEARGDVAPNERARGLPIGALTSQHFANAYLDSADRLLLRQPGVGTAVRYMDDIVWFCASRAAAQVSLTELRGHLAEVLHLRLKDRVVLRPSEEGLLFCGLRIKPGVLLAGPRKLARARQAAQRLRAAEAAATAPALLQRAHDNARAALLPAQAGRFWRGLWAERLASES